MATRLHFVCDFNFGLAMTLSWAGLKSTNRKENFFPLLCKLPHRPPLISPVLPTLSRRRRPASRSGAPGAYGGHPVCSFATEVSLLALLFPPLIFLSKNIQSKKEMEQQDDPNPPPLADRMARRSRKKQRVPSLSEDLVLEILSRVPYRSLCCFKCISRSWLILCGSDPIRTSARNCLS